MPLQALPTLSRRTLPGGASALTGGWDILDVPNLSRGSGPNRRETGSVPFPSSFLFSEDAAPPGPTHDVGRPEGRGIRGEEIDDRRGTRDEFDSRRSAGVHSRHRAAPGA